MWIIGPVIIHGDGAKGWAAWWGFVCTVPASWSLLGAFAAFVFGSEPTAAPSRWRPSRAWSLFVLASFTAATLFHTVMPVLFLP